LLDVARTVGMQCCGDVCLMPLLQLLLLRLLQACITCLVYTVCHVDVQDVHALLGNIPRNVYGTGMARLRFAGCRVHHIHASTQWATSHYVLRLTLSAGPDAVCSPHSSSAQLVILSAVLQAINFWDLTFWVLASFDSVASLKDTLRNRVQVIEGNMLLHMCCDLDNVCANCWRVCITACPN
jgi:hypothetical protein